jgi:hypothetical protein
LAAAFAFAAIAAAKQPGLQVPMLGPKAAAAAALKRPGPSAAAASAPKRLCTAARPAGQSRLAAAAAGVGARNMLDNSFPPAASGEITARMPLQEDPQECQNVNDNATDA